MYNILRKCVMTLFLLIIAACGNKDKQTLTKIIDIIKKEAEHINEDSISDTINVVTENTLQNTNTDILFEDIEQGDIVVAEDIDFSNSIVEKKSVDQLVSKNQNRPKSYSPEFKSAKKTIKQKSSLTAIDSGSYIKIGDDKSSIQVKKSKSEKITVVVLTGSKVKLADVYIYAIPVGTKLVRNHNTLVGFVNNLEVVNNQAQFTRFWTGKRANGTYFRPGKYNIYIEYRYKNGHQNVIGRAGRYWGGSKRQWIVELL